MDHILTAAPGLPALWEQLHAAFEKRLTTPTSQCVGPVLGPVTMTEADCEEADMCIHRWKQSGGPARDNERRALDLQIQAHPEQWL